MTPPQFIQNTKKCFVYRGVICFLVNEARLFATATKDH